MEVGQLDLLARGFEQLTENSQAEACATNPENLNQKQRPNQMEVENRSKAEPPAVICVTEITLGSD
jgi:hypothetical protein